MFNKKLDYIEDKYGLSVSFKWFTPMAFFLLFFCIAWDSFLIFWYGAVVSGGAPWIFAVFPIVHVAVGVGLTYYTLCLFFNKTFIDVMDGRLDVRHGPIPWWKGNVHLSTKEIEQIYVKEVVSSNDGNTTRAYGLHAKMVDSADQRVLTVGGLDSQQAQELEHRIENYIGIDNAPVVGEYNYGKVTTLQPQARRQRKTENQSPLGFLYDIGVGESVTYLEKNHQIQHISQYDWNNGDSDKSLQLLDENRKETLLYIQKNRGLTQAFKEEKIPLFETNQIAFQKITPPASITFNNQMYFLDAHAQGESFLSDSTTPVEAEQWIYLKKGNIESVRIVNHQNQMTFYKGEKAVDLQFEKTDNSLDLRELNIDYNKRNSDEGYV